MENQATEQLGIDDGVAEGFEQVGLSRARRTADHQVLVASHPFEGGQGVLGGCGDRGAGRVPGVEGLARRETGPACRRCLGHRVLPALDLGFEQDPE